MVEEATLPPAAAVVLYGIAQLTGGISKDAFEGFMQVALVGKARLRGYLGNVLPPAEQGLRSTDSSLHQPGMRSESGLPGKDADEMKSTEAGNAGQGFYADIFGIVRIKVLNDPAKSSLLGGDPALGVGLFGMTGEQPGKEGQRHGVALQLGSAMAGESLVHQPQCLGQSRVVDHPGTEHRQGNLTAADILADLPHAIG